MLIIDKTIFMYRLSVASTGITTSIKNVSVATKCHRIYCSHVSFLYQLFHTIDLLFYIFSSLHQYICIVDKSQSQITTSSIPLFSDQLVLTLHMVGYTDTEGYIAKLVTLYTLQHYIHDRIVWVIKVTQPKPIHTGIRQISKLFYSFVTICDFTT